MFAFCRIFGFFATTPWNANVIMLET